MASVAVVLLEKENLIGDVAMKRIATANSKDR
jgi:hypothetical protein